MTVDDLAEGPMLAASLRWFAAGVLVLAVHAGVIVALVREPEPAVMATGGEPAMEVELDPVEGDKVPDETLPAETSGELATASAAAADSAAAVDAPTVVKAVPPPPPAPPKIEPAPVPSPEPQTTELASPPLPSDPPKIEPATPPPAEPPPSTTKLAPPPVPEPPPVPGPPETELTPEPPAIKAAPPPLPSPPPPEPPKSEPAPAPPAPTEAQAVPPAPTPSRASAASKASAAAEEAAPTVQKLSSGRDIAWRGELVAHLNTFRRFPPGLGSGTARIGFTVDGEGRVTAVSVVMSSGNATLDAAARELVERASPFPTPPAGVSGKSLSFVVPVRFDGRRP